MRPPAGRHRPNIDRLFASLAEEFGPRVVGILLSGLAQDGVRGLGAVRDAGGRTAVQDPAEAAFPDLPAAAIAAGVAQRVLPADGVLALVAEVLAGDGSETPLDPGMGPAA